MSASLPDNRSAPDRMFGLSGWSLTAANFSAVMLIGWLLYYGSVVLMPSLTHEFLAELRSERDRTAEERRRDLTYFQSNLARDLERLLNADENHRKRDLDAQKDLHDMQDSLKREQQDLQILMKSIEDFHQKMLDKKSQTEQKKDVTGDAEGQGFWATLLSGE